MLQDDRDEAVNKAHCSDESRQLLKTLFVRPEEGCGANSAGELESRAPL
jgi:hypothetical protein